MSSLKFDIRFTQRFFQVLRHRPLNIRFSDIRFVFSQCALGFEDSPPDTGSRGRAPKGNGDRKGDFSLRVRSLMEVLNHSCNFDDGNIDIMLSGRNLLYNHAVRLASVNIVEDATIAKGPFIF